MRQVFITGATGFIGGRLAEVAYGQGLSVTGLVRTWSHAARLSRLPVRMAGGDILQPESLREAMTGCDVVFHCAVDRGISGRAHRRSSIQGTTNVMQTALEIGVKRVVHLSSAAVYSYRPGPDAVTEEGAYRYSGDAYCDGKIEAEKVALRYHHEHGLPVTVLRPTIVYGPFGFWTVDTVHILREGRMVLVNGGTGICNCLYVDNLVQAMLLAAEHEQAVGEVFHISDAQPVTWREFIEAHAHALGESYLPLPGMSVREMAEARAAPGGVRLLTSSWKQALRLASDPQMRRALSSIPLVKRSVQAGRSLLPAPTRRWLGRRLSGESVLGEPGDIPPRIEPLVLAKDEVKMLTTFDNVAFSIEKARCVLGYEPRIGFSEGMRRTAAWIQWARL
jgi:nucleoside-diphosphate-sugar epimerase